jgi:hypothetical protein
MSAASAAAAAAAAATATGDDDDDHDDGGDQDGGDQDGDSVVREEEQEEEEEAEEHEEQGDGDEEEEEEEEEEEPAKAKRGRQKRARPPAAASSRSRKRAADGAAPRPSRSRTVAEDKTPALLDKVLAADKTLANDRAEVIATLGTEFCRIFKRRVCDGKMRTFQNKLTRAIIDQVASVCVMTRVKYDNIVHEGCHASEEVHALFSVTLTRQGTSIVISGVLEDTQDEHWSLHQSAENADRLKLVLDIDGDHELTTDAGLERLIDFVLPATAAASAPTATEMFRAFDADQKMVVLKSVTSTLDTVLKMYVRRAYAVFAATPGTGFDGNYFVYLGHISYFLSNIK